MTTGMRADNSPQVLNGSIMVQGDIEVTPDMNYLFPSVKRVKVENVGTTPVTDLTVVKTDSENAFTVYDGSNGATPVGPWCTPSTCTDRCGTSLGASATCYVYVQAKDNVGINATPTSGTLTVGSQQAGETINLTLQNRGVLYAGGLFFVSTPEPFYVARYAGDTGWQNIGGGFNLLINSLAVDGQGKLYVGGFFSDGSGQYATAYNGSTWQNLGGGPMAFNGNIRALAVDAQDRLYAGGSFTNGSGQQYVAQYSGGSWNNLGSRPIAFNGNIRALAVDAQDRLYVGGSFTDGTNQYVARYANGSWSNLGTGPIAFNETIFALAIDSQDRLYAGGNFTDGANVYVAQYNGSSWNNLGSGPAASPFNNPINALKTSQLLSINLMP